MLMENHPGNGYMLVEKDENNQTFLSLQFSISAPGKMG